MMSIQEIKQIPLAGLLLFMLSFIVQSASAQQGAMFPDEFKPLALSRDASLGEVLYSDNTMTVYSQSLSLERKICRSETVTIETTNPDEMAAFLAKRAEFNARAEEFSKKGRAEIDAIYAKTQKELAKLSSYPVEQRGTKWNEIMARQQQRLDEYSRNFEAQVPKPPKPSQQVIEFAKLRVLLKNLPDNEPIIYTVPKYPESMSLEEQMATLWKPAPSALNVYIEKILPLITLACPKIRAVQLQLGFHEIVAIMDDKSEFFDVVEMDLAIQPSGEWALQQFKENGVPFRISAVGGLAQKQVIAARDGVPKAWLNRDEKAKNSAEFEDLRLRVDATGIESINQGCYLGDCEQRCQKSPHWCPGGPKSALIRGVWASCSNSNFWHSENCQIIIGQFGKHSQKDPIQIPSQFQSLYKSLSTGKVFTRNEMNLAFASGLGKYLVDKCQILQPEDSNRMNQFANAGINTMMGSDYMNPGNNLKTATNAQEALKLGVALGENIACRMPESYLLAKGLLKSIDVSDGVTPGGQSHFVTSCTPHFSSTHCQCLADEGRAVIPDINSRSYQRELIPYITQKSPIVGISLAIKCGIDRY